MIDYFCTILFTIEVVANIIALGFFSTCVKNKSAYVMDFHRFMNLLIVGLAITDIFVDLGRYDGLLNAFKSLKML